MKNKIKILIVVFISLILIGIIGLFIYFKIEEKNKLEQERFINNKIKNNYNEFVITNKETNLYDKNNKKVGTISKNTYIKLDKYKDKNKYYKLKDLDYYILYSDVKKIEEKLFDEEYKTYKNYIPFNENIITNDNYKIYFTDKNYIELKDENIYTIIIKEENKYGIAFNDQLVYIKNKDVKDIVESENSNAELLNSIAVLNYHFTIDETSDERKECLQDICIPQTQVDEEIKYLSDNGFYATTMRDLELFLTNKINLPKKSVTITIDDGWYLPRMINILNKYQMNGTLFLIGSLASKDAYISDYLEIHSHTWNMHTPGVCRGEHGGGILCLDNETIKEDLLKSKESLNNTKYFCFPFYEYNENAINILKELDFKMAFVGGNIKAKKTNDIYKVPRYVIYDGLTLNEFEKIVN